MLFVVYSLNINAQTTLIQEGFETIPFQFTSSQTGGVNHWNPTTNYQKSGLKADSCTVQTGISTFLLSDNFNTQGKHYVLLQFSHIAKINQYDWATIEISVNDPNTWTQLTGAMYLGSSLIFSSINRFSSSSYPEWDSAHDSIAPNNTWWKNETFDISSLAKDTINVAIRFRLRDFGTAGNNGSYGWLIDDVKISGAVNEIIPPAITLNAPIYQDSVFFTGPYTVSANITDASGIGSAKLFYKVNAGAWDSIPMVAGASNNYSADIPSYTYLNTITYYVQAKDSVQNVATTPQKSFIIKQPSISIQVGTGTTNQGYPYNMLAAHTRSASLYKHSEINQFGNISSIAWKVATGATTNCPIRFYLKSIPDTVQTATTWANDTIGATLVYAGTMNFPDTGWKTFNLATPYHYSSGSLLVLCEANLGAAGTTPYFYYTVSSAGSHQYYQVATGNGSLNTLRPNIKLVFPALNYSQDAGITEVTSPTGTITAATNQILKVKLRNFATNPLQKVNIYWQIDNNTPTLFAWNGSLLQDVITSPITISNTASFTLGNHIIKSWTDLPNDSLDQNHLNDTSYTSVFACLQVLNGTYTIGGVSADFPNFTSANSALQSCGVSGPVIFNVNPGTYNESITFTPVPNASLYSNITFQAANGDSTSVIIQDSSTDWTTNFIFKLNGANYLRFKKLTFNQTSTSYGTCINYSNGASNNQFISNRFLVPITNANSLDRVIIYSPTGATSVDSNNIFMNNLFLNGSYGIYLGGGSTTALEVGNIISGNTFLNQNGYGIFTYYQDGAQILNNTISTNVANVSFYGIYSTECFNKMKFVGNKIYIPNSYGFGIYSEFNTGQLNSEGLIANNFFSIGGISSSTAFGIYNYYSTYQNYYYNSVDVTNTNSASSAMYITGSGSLNLNLKNNIFSNSGNGMANYVLDTTGVLSNYNDMFTNGAYIGYWLANRTTLANWRTATGRDLNSISTNPYFFSPTNLHLSNISLNGKAIPITGITTDIDGQSRNATTPDIGADEFTPPDHDIAPISVIAPVSACAMSTTETVTVRLKNFGLLPITSATLYYSINNGTPVQGTFTGNIASDSSYDFTFSTPANLAFQTDYIFKFWAVMANDTNHLNDTIPYWFVNSGYDLNIASYTQGFEATNYVADWTSNNVNNDASFWTFPYNSAINAYQGTYSAHFQNAATQAANDWMFSRCFILDATKKYKIEYWYKVENNAYPQNLIVKYGNATTSLAMVNTVITQSNLVNTTYQKASAIFIPPSSGVYYLGFLTTSPASAYGFYIDNINLSLVPDQEASIIDMPTPNGGCGLGNETVSLNIKNNGSGIIVPNTLTAYYKIIGSASTISQLITDTIHVDSTLYFSFNTLANLAVTVADSNFKIKSWISLLGDPYQFNDSIQKTILSKKIPPPPIPTSATVAYAALATLTATSSDTIFWYNVPSGGTQLVIGTSYTTPPLYMTTPFYVEDAPYVPNIYATIGTGVVTIPQPFNTFWHDSKTQMLLTAAEIHAAGGVTGILQSIAFDVTTVGGQAMNGLNIWVQQTSLTSLTNFVSTGWTTVYTGNYTVPAIGWQTLSLQTPFNWDGVSNLLINICFDNSSYTSATNVNSSTIANMAVEQHADNSTGCTFSVPTAMTSRPNIRLKFTGKGCSSIRVPDTAYVISIPNEAAILSMTSPVTDCNYHPELVSIKIRNYGFDTINGNLTATYKLLNTGTSVTENVPNIVLPGDSLIYTFTTPILPGLSSGNIDTTFNIQAYINLTGDPYHLNDTIYKTVTFNYTPPAPVLSNTSIPYGTSAILHAISTDSTAWFNVASGGVSLINSHYFNTPILYNTTVFWAQASIAGGSHSWTFDNDLNGWTSVNSCSSTNDFVWNSDGGIGTAFIADPASTSAGLLTSPIIDVSNIDTVTITFKHKYITEAGYDHGYVAYSLNGGTTWAPFVPTTNAYNNPSTTTFATDPLSNCTSTTRASFSGTSAGGYIVSSGKLPITGASSLELAFVFQSDISVSGTGWYIDSVAIDAGVGGCPSVRLPDTVFVAAPPACDVGITQILDPISNAYLGTNEHLKVMIKNFGLGIQTSIPVKYKVGTAAVVSEIFNGTLNPGDSTIYTFTTAINMSVTQIYNIVAYTAASCDVIYTNDTIHKSIEHSVYCASTATYTSDEDIGNVTFGNINNGSATPTYSNTTATHLYTDFTTSLSPIYLAKGSTYPISVGIILSGTYSYTGWLNAFIDYNRDGVFETTPTERVFSSAYSPYTLTGSITIPTTAASGLSRMRFVAQENGTLATTLPCGTYGYGETEDYAVMIYAPIQHDAGVVAFVEPSDSVYNETDSLPVIATIHNFGTTAITSVLVTATFNALPLGSVTWTGNLAPGAETNVTFPNIMCHAGFNNNLCAYTTLAGDSNTFNDNLCKVFRGRPAHDVGAAALVEPTSNSCFTNTETVIVRIKNFGMKTLKFNQDTVKVYANMTGASSVLLGPAILASDSLAVGDSMNVTMPTTANMSLGGNYIFNCYTQMTSDGNSSNNTFISSVLSASITALLPDTVGFSLFTGADLNTGYPHWTEGTGVNVPTGTTSAWTSQTGLGSPTNVTARINLYSNTRNEWLVGSKFLATAGTTLDFDAAVTDFNSVTLADSMGTDDSVKVMLSTNCGVSWNKVFALTKANNLPNTLTHFSINLGSYAGQLLRVAFKAQDGPVADPNNYDFHLDNINLWNKDIDVRVNSIVHLASDILYVNLDDTVTIKIENLGNVNATNIPVYYWLTDNVGTILTTPVVETYTAVITPGQIATYNFATLFHPTQQVFNLCARTLYNYDMDTTNDKSCKSLIALVGINEIDYDGFMLGQNIPNPANDNTLINYTIPSNGKVRFQIMSLVGQEMYAEETNAQSGTNQITVNTRNLAAGIYYYSVTYKGRRITKKMIIEK